MQLVKRNEDDQWKAVIQGQKTTWMQINISKKEKIHQEQEFSHKIPLKQLRIKIMNDHVYKYEIIIYKTSLW